MQLSHRFLSFYFTLIIVLSVITTNNATPTYGTLDSIMASSSVDDDYYYASAPYVEPLTDYRLSRLRRGYYYVEDGYITAVPASTAVSSKNRRQDTVGDDGANSGDTQYHHKQAHKRKKLFVPNFFG